jgi:hypothetical protein
MRCWWLAFPCVSSLLRHYFRHACDHRYRGAVLMLGHAFLFLGLKSGFLLVSATFCLVAYAVFLIRIFKLQVYRSCDNPNLPIYCYKLLRTFFSPVK